MRSRKREGNERRKNCGAGGCRMGQRARTTIVRTLTQPENRMMLMIMVVFMLMMMKVAEAEETAAEAAVVVAVKRVL